IHLHMGLETGGYPKSVASIYRGEIAGTIGFNEINKASKIGSIGYWLGEGFLREFKKLRVFALLHYLC
ncbi:hypothetical protein ABEY41_28770, partial [Peribacillus butanolivorans]